MVLSSVQVAVWIKNSVGFSSARVPLLLSCLSIVISFRVHFPTLCGLPLQRASTIAFRWLSFLWLNSLFISRSSRSYASHAFWSFIIFSCLWNFRINLDLWCKVQVYPRPNRTGFSCPSSSNGVSNASHILSYLFRRSFSPVFPFMSFSNFGTRSAYRHLALAMACQLALLVLGLSPLCLFVFLLVEMITVTAWWSLPL